jgi:hypothetical protein
VRLIALAVTAAVQSDDPVISSKVWQDVRSKLPFNVLAEAVNQNDGLSGASLHISDAYAVRVEELVTVHLLS